MPWSGGAFTRTNGVHTGATLWAQDRDAGTKILASRHDTHDQDLADGINSTLEKSGSNAATGNLNIGSNRLTAVADGTAKTDAATVNQIQSNAPAFQATDTGTANAYVIALSPAVTAYAAGQAFTFKAGAASTTASTLNVNGLGTKAIKKLHDQDIASGDIESGSIVTVVYDGTNFQMTSQLATEGGGVTLSGSTANTVTTVTGADAIIGEAKLLFDPPKLTIGSGAAEDPVLVWDGNAQDWYAGIDDTDDDFKIGLGSTVGTTSHIVIDETGAVTKPLQPAFFATGTTNENATGDGTAITVGFGSEVYDVNGDYDGTNQFTAPVTGKYYLFTAVSMGGVTTSHVTGKIVIVTSNREYIRWFSPTNMEALAGANTLCVATSCIADMDASDTATISLTIQEGSKVVDIFSTATQTYFGGALLV
jgi:hypothetical protein|tara:strand:- start:2309 stop:3574 length:1266 start_codon:yes stop_codon:yes gene_type:complete